MSKEVKEQVINVEEISQKEEKTCLKVKKDIFGISSEDRKKNKKKLAGAISHSLRVDGEINVRAFGPKAIGKATKALGIARKYVSSTHDLDLAYSPAFITTQIDNSTITGICFCVFTQPKDVEVDLDKVVSVLKVKSDGKEVNSFDRKRNVKKLAGAITHSIEDHRECLVRAVGDDCINKACKAIAIARGYIATKGPDLYCWNDHFVTNMGGNERTGIVFYCFSNDNIA